MFNFYPKITFRMVRCYIETSLSTDNSVGWEVKLIRR